MESLSGWEEGQKKVGIDILITENLSLKLFFSLGNYGGIFMRSGLKPTDILVYCTRPGLRIWVSDSTGTVQQTLLFKVANFK